MDSKGTVFQSSRGSLFITLATAWTVLAFNLIVLSSTLVFTLAAIVDSIGTTSMAVAFMIYIWFGAPLVSAGTSLIFLKSALAGAPTAKWGLMASFGVLILWIVMLAYQFGGTGSRV